MKQVPPESRKVCQVLCRICLELLKLKKPSHSSVMGITRNLYDKQGESGKPVFLIFNFLFLIIFEPFTSEKINYNEKRSTGCSTSVFHFLRASGSKTKHFRPWVGKAKMCLKFVHFVCQKWTFPDFDNKTHNQQIFHLPLWPNG